MKYCFGTVCWGGYLERYIHIFVNNYITLYRKLIDIGINYEDIIDPRIVYISNTDEPGEAAKNASLKLKRTTGKNLILVEDKHNYTQYTIMYSTRNRLRLEFRKLLPKEEKVFFYFPIDDSIRSEAVIELVKLGQSKKLSACMFKFCVEEGAIHYNAGTRPINSYKDIHATDWGGYCAYNILDEEDCPLYPKIAIPNVAFYADLYKAGYKQYESESICIDHLRHQDSHHFKVKDSRMSDKVTKFLIAQRKELYENGYK